MKRQTETYLIYTAMFLMSVAVWIGLSFIVISICEIAGFLVSG
jgi:hypothetical protein